MTMTLEQLRMIGLDELSNPLTYRFNLATSWGITSQEFSIDAPDLADDLPAALEFGTRLWKLTIANAITTTCQLSFLELVRWKHSPLPQLGATGAPSGVISVPPGGQKDSACVIQLTGHTDKFGRRRMFMPDFPKVWNPGGVLTEAGTKGVYNAVAPLFMATMGPEFDWIYKWLIAYPDVVTPDPSNLRGVAFRRVSHLRICSYTGKAPDTVPIDWP